MPHHPLRVVAALALLVPAMPARAFAPTDLSAELEPQRTWMRHEAEQERLTRESEPLRAFRAEGGDWKVAWDERSHTPRYLWGPGIPMPTGDADRLARGVADLLDRHRALLGFERGQLVLDAASYHAGSDTWYVSFDVLRDGDVGVWHHGISARIKHGHLILVSVQTSPEAPVTGAWQLSPRDAEQIAILDGPAPAATHTDRTVVPKLLELDTDEGLELRRVWLVNTRTADPPGIWVSFVDAESGELLAVHNQVMFLDGTVTGLHHERLLDGSPLVEDPMPLAIVRAGASSATTDVDGTFSIAGSSLSTTLHGQYLNVKRQDGPNGQLTDSGPDLQWTTASADQSEIDSYVYIHQVRDWGNSVDPSVRMMSAPLVSNVNLNDVCNAYFDGAVNFFRAGSFCNNTGQIADVEYHEWGHGFHYYSIEPGGQFDSSLSEGAADTVAFFMTGDHRIGPTFYVNGGAIRDVAPDRVYPDDYNTSPRADPHENGLIFAGTMWDLLGILQGEYGDDQGQRVTEQIYAGILRGGTDIPGTFYEALVADDDDGDLGNGTPHDCEIIDAFSEHGLGSSDGSGIAAAPEHEPVVTTPDGLRTDLVFHLVTDDCHTGQAKSATLHYRLNGKGEWKTGEADISGTDVTGHVPKQDDGTFVEYWLDGVDDSGLPFVAPSSGEYAPYTMYVGDVLTVGCDTFDDGDGGYHGKRLDGDGSSDWAFAAPKGMNGDPSSAFTGKKVWGTDPGGDNSDGLYQGGVASRLRSPELDTYHYTGVFLQYRRWLRVEDATYDQATIEADGKTVWTNASNAEGSGNHLDREWISHAVDLKGRADQSSVSLNFTLTSDNGAEFGGWNIDDVCLLAPDTVDNRLGVSHFDAFDLGGPVGLTWTNPRHEPVKRVVVVRRRDRYPESWDDGDIVIDESDVAIGETVQRVDPNGGGGHAFYAAYATDGSDWSSFTVQGVNADDLGSAGTPGGELIFGNGEPFSAGCGCDGVPGPASGAGLVLAGLALARRRRR